MPSIAVSPPELCQTESDHPRSGGPVQRSIPDAIDTLEAARANYQAAPADAGAALAFLDARRCAARAIGGLARSAKSDPALPAIRTAVAGVVASGALDAVVAAEDLALADVLAAQGWPGLLGAMLLSPAWQWPAAPHFEQVPEWLWGDWARWVFTAPQGFTSPGQAESYASAMLPRLEELARWAERNRGSAAVRAALDAFIRASSIPLYFCRGSLRRHAEARGRLLRAALGIQRADTTDLEASPRYGRKLRVGFVNRHFGPQTETYTTLPTFEHLDPELFEVVLFTISETGTVLEQHARSRAAEFHVLPRALPEQLDALRSALLDVVVFGTNVTAVCNEVTQLALHRVAPLQVVNNSSCVTTGLPTIDLYVSGSLTERPDAADDFTERLALLPGPTHAFNYEADQVAATAAPTRAEFGIPADAPLFVSAANYFKIIPEMQHAWARLLARVPAARLLVHPFNPNWSSTYPIERFTAEFHGVLAQHGVSPDRLVISTTRYPSRVDVRELLRLGDVYLDTYPFGGVNSLIDPLETGVPVLVWEGETMRARMGAALLRTLELEELIVADEETYLGRAERLAADPAYRAALRERISERMAVTPLFLDQLAASDAFGALLVQAYDELADAGAARFRRDRTTLVVPPGRPAEQLLAEGEAALLAVDTETARARARAMLAARPNDPAGRRLLGRTLLARGEAARALPYLMAALNGNEHDGRHWYDVAVAMRATGQPQQALAALEAGLQVDPQLIEAWELVAELARAVGSEEMAAEAETVIRQIREAS